MNASGDTKKGRATMKPIKKGLASGNRGRAPAPTQNLLQGRLMTFADIFSEINLDSSITYVIIFTFNVSVNDSKIKSYCLFLQSFSSVKIQIFLFSNDFRHVFDIAIMQK
jgi:hypothetical protein